MKNNVAIAISGGIDSLVTAHLLKEEGRRLTGIHFVSGYGKPGLDKNELLETAHAEMGKMSDQLGIDIKIIDISAQFKAQVVDYFTGAYLKGETPNPCLKCNPAIKFGLLLEEAEKLGCDFLATGHYARIKEGSQNHWHLLKGMDTQKDQSYFLAFLNRNQLSKALFPLGGLRKDETRRIASENGLEPVSKSESQDICFISDTTYADFLVKETGFTPKPGPIVNLSGKQVGEHKGLHSFTTGQRKGINCPAEAPYYVVRTDLKTNTLVVGFKQDLLKKECLVSGLSWINGAPGENSEIFTRIRYRHKEVPSTLTLMGEDRARVRFHDPQSAVTPGQGAVFYLNDEVLGAGWIER